MKLLVTTNARLYKSNGKYYTPLVYGYDFFQRYLAVFEEIRLVAHVEPLNNHCKEKLLRVDGENLEVFELPFPHGKVEYIKKYSAIQKDIKKATRDCDAALLRIPDQLAFQLFGVVKRNKIPVAIEVTSDSWEFFSSNSSKSILRPFLRFLWHYKQKKCCATANGVSYVTEFGLQKRYPPKIKTNDKRFTTHYTSAGIDESIITTPRDFISNKKLNLLHVSTSISSYVKGHKELISSFIQLREQGYLLKLHLVGSGKLELDIQSKINDSGYKDDIKFYGLVQKDELYDIYKKSDIFVFPSYREGLPRVVLEAMAHGLPCITTDLPGTRELLDKSMLVPIKSAESITDKVISLISSTQLLNEQSERNISVVKHYSDKIVVEKRNAFYNKLYSLAEKEKL